jgi:hypothetical protein
MTRIVIPADTEVARLRAENARLRVEVRDLRSVLEPFGASLRGNYSHQPPQLAISCGNGKDDLRWVIPLQCWRNARAALSGPAPGEGE